MLAIDFLQMKKHLTRMKSEKLHCSLPGVRVIFKTMRLNKW